MIPVRPAQSWRSGPTPPARSPFDRFSDDVAQSVRIEGVELPAMRAVVVHEPAVTRVLLFVRCWEGGKTG
jgi:hypothetical protein